MPASDFQFRIGAIVEAIRAEEAKRKQAEAKEKGKQENGLMGLSDGEEIIEDDYFDEEYETSDIHSEASSSIGPFNDSEPEDLEVAGPTPGSTEVELTDMKRMISHDEIN